MKQDTVHLTFKTTKKTSEILTFIAHKSGMTQPELINQICNDFIETMAKCAKEELDKEGHKID